MAGPFIILVEQLLTPLASTQSLVFMYKDPDNYYFLLFTYVAWFLCFSLKIL